MPMPARRLPDLDMNLAAVSSSAVAAAKSATDVARTPKLRRGQDDGSADVCSGYPAREFTDAHLRRIVQRSSELRTMKLLV